MSPVAESQRRAPSRVERDIIQAAREILHKIVAKYEFFYLEPQAASIRAQQPLTRERYAAFEHWVGELLETKEALQTAYEYWGEDLLEDITQAVRCYESLADRRNEGESAEKPLLEREYSFLMDEVKDPTYEELVATFGENHVQTSLNQNPAWHLDPSCLWRIHPGERRFRIKTFANGMNTEALITQLEAEGYRPATHAELYALYQKHPELWHDIPNRVGLVALGSFIATEIGIRAGSIVSDEDGFHFTTASKYKSSWPAWQYFLCAKQMPVE